jgi:hypothetical protein
MARLLASISSGKKGKQMTASLRREISDALEANAFVPLHTIEDSRRRLASLAARAHEG